MKAVAITGKTCQKKRSATTGSRVFRLALRNEIPGESGGGGEAPESTEGECAVTMMRESSSILPRLLRSPLTNMRQRSSAMAVSWLRRWMVTEFSLATHRFLRAVDTRIFLRASPVLTDNRRCGRLGVREIDLGLDGQNLGVLRKLPSLFCVYAHGRTIGLWTGHDDRFQHKILFLKLCPTLAGHTTRTHVRRPNRSTDNCSDFSTSFYYRDFDTAHRSEPH